MGCNWPTVKLVDYCAKIGSGATPKGGASVYLDKGPFSLIRSQNVYNDGFNNSGLAYINDEAAEKLRNVQVEANDILLNITGDSVARVCLAPENFLPARVNQHVMIIRPNEKDVDSRFLRYFMVSPSTQAKLLGMSAVGATRNALTKGMIENFEFPKPSLSVQRVIADVLSAFDKKIELNRQINQTLEEMAQAMFKSWFVDFDPVKAKVTVLENGGTLAEAELAAMEVISGKSAQQLETLQTQHPEQYQQLQHTASLFPSAMQDSELGEIPVGWELKAFGDMLSKTIGGDWGKEEPDEKHTEMVKILRGTDLPKVFSGDDTGVPTRYVEAKKLKTRLLEDGDIIIEVSGGSKDQPTGRSLFLTQNLIDRLNSRLEPASFCRLFRPINKEVGHLLAVHLIKIYSDGKTWHYQVQSTGISNFQTKVFLEKELVMVPNKEVLEHFSELVKPIFQKIHSSESNSLKELRNTLLPKLLSGELQLSTEDAA